jgi:CheY-like chemotaxis protein
VGHDAPSDKTDLAPGSRAVQEPGTGSTWRFLLTRAGDETAAPPPPLSETVLVVDDERVVRLLVVRALLRAGYAVLEAGGGREALAVVERHRGRIHLLLTDVGMPDVGGRELADRLRAACPGLRVLFLSGYSDEEAVSRGVSHDPDQFLTKPVSAAALARKVREVLDSPPACR